MFVVVLIFELELEKLIFAGFTVPAPVIELLFEDDIWQFDISSTDPVPTETADAVLDEIVQLRNMQFVPDPPCVIAVTLILSVKWTEFSDCIPAFLIVTGKQTVY